MGSHSFKGQVVNRSTLVGVPNVTVEALDDEGIQKGLVAVTTTDADGNFVMSVSDELIEQLFGRSYPVVYFRVLSGLDLLASTEKTLRWHLRGDGEGRILTRYVLAKVARLADYVVSGRLVHGETGPMAGKLIRIFDRNVSGTTVAETELTTSSLRTDARGSFRFAYRPTTKAAADLVIRGYNPDTTIVADHLECQAPPVLEVELVVWGTEYRGPTEYATERAKVVAALGAVQLRNATTAQQSFVACSAGVATSVVSALVGAATLTTESPRVSEEVYYGLLRQGLPANRPQLFGHPLPEIERRLLRSVADNLVSPAIERTMGTAVRQQLEDEAVSVSFSARSGGRGLGEITAITPGSTTVQREAFVRKALKHTGLADDFWTAVAADPTFTSPSTLVAALRFTVDAGAVTFNHPTLLTYLHTQRPTTINVAKDLARYTETDWLAMLNAQAVTPPPETPGATTAEKRAAFAAMIARTVEGRYRTAVFAQRTKTAEPTAPLTTFFNNNTAFDFETTRVPRYLAENPTALNAVAVGDRPALIERLKKIERITKATHDYKEANAVLTAGYASARQIYEKGQDAFVAQLEAPIGADAATRVYQKATWMSYSAGALLTKYQPSGSPNVDWIANLSSAAVLIPALADWNTVMGSLNACQCDHCTSFYSPAAYFADIASFLKRQVTSGTSAMAILFDKRPDLPLIELSCANSIRRVPTIDLINEILEVGLWQLNNPTEAWPGVTTKTTATEEELLAAPEVLYSTQYAAAYEHLRTAVYPFDLPFNLFVDEARVYLDHLGVPRHELIDALKGAGAPQPSPLTFDDWIAAERVGLSLDARTVVVGPASGQTYWGVTANWPNALASVPVFLKQAGLTYDELRELLATRYANPVAINPSSSCDVNQLSLSGIDATNLDRLHRFLRLRKRLGWSSLALDEVIQALGDGNIDAPMLVKLGGMRALENRFTTPRRQMLAWWKNIDHHSLVAGHDANDFRPSLYAEVFLNRALVNPVETAFETILTPTDNVDEHRAAIRAALAISDADMALLLDTAAANAELSLERVLDSTAPSSLTLENLSRLYRIVSFAGALRMSVADLRILTALANGNPLDGDTGTPATPASTLAFLDILNRFRAADVAVAELHYLFRHATPPGSSVAPSEATLNGWRLETEAIVAAAHKSAQGIQDPDGQRSKSLIAEIVPTLTDLEVGEVLEIVGGTSTEASLTNQWTYIQTRIGFVFENAADAESALVWQPGGAAPVPLPNRSIPDRYAYLVERLERCAISVRDLRAWVVATFQVDEESASHILLSKIFEASIAAGAPVVRDFVSSTTPGAPATTWGDPDPPVRKNHMLRIDKMARIVKSLRLTARELKTLFPESGLPPAGDLPWFNPKLLPVQAPVSPYTADLTAARARFTAWLRMADMVYVRDRIEDGSDALLSLFAAAAATGAVLADVRKKVAAATGWNAADVDTLSDRFGGTLASYQNEAIYMRLHHAVRMVEELGVPAATAIAWTNVGADLATAESIGLETRKAAKEKHQGPGWHDVARPLRNILRERQRDALVGAYMAQTPSLGDVDALFEYLFLDVQMTSCDRTSRLVLANGSMQMFTERALLALEPGVTFSADARNEWEWMSRYRVWEANRKVCIYPENWIEPELRDDKTPLFKALETQLLQAELTNESAEEAVRTYVRGLMDISNLEIVAVAEEKPTTLAYNVYSTPEPSAPDGYWTPYTSALFASTGTTEETIHVFGRTGSPAVYYHRRRIGQRWTPWQKLELDIEGDHLIPVLYHDQLFLFWPLIQEKSEPTADQAVPDQDTVQDPKQYWDIRMAWSVLRNGQWSRKRLSTGSIAMRPSNDPLNETSLDRLTFFGRTVSTNIEVEAVYVPDSGDNNAIIGRLRYDPCTDVVHAIQGYEGDVSDVSNPGYPQPWESVELEHSAAWKRLRQRYTEASYYNGLRMYVPQSNTYLNDPPYMKILADGPMPLLPGAPKFVLTQDRSKYDNAQTNVIVQDSARAFLARRLMKADEAPPAQGDYVEPTDPSDGWLARFWRFELMSHPYACAFVRQIERRGVPGLLRWSKQKEPMQLKTQNLDVYVPDTDRLAGPFPQEIVDFSSTGAMSIYNWELFFHAPFAIAVSFLRNGKYREAREWLHCIFDPTDRTTQSKPKRFWKFKPFYELENLADLQAAANTISANINVNLLQALFNKEKTTPAAEEIAADIAAWRDDPLNPYAIARIRMVAFQKAVVMRYLDVLIGWADELYAEDTRESINEATQLYVVAARLLGRKPVSIEPPTPVELKNYTQLASELDALSNADIEAEGMAPSAPPYGYSWDISMATPSSAFKQKYFCIPPNDKLLAYWDVVADRLFKIRHCQNIEGVERDLALFAPPIDPGLLVRAKALGIDLSSVLKDLNAANPKHRFAVLHAKAVEFTSFVVSFGAELLAAREKGDAEHVARLRQTHEVSLLGAVRESKKKQVSEARQGLDSLRRTRATVEARRAYYAGLPPRIPQETRYVDETMRAQNLAASAREANAQGASAALIPDITIGSAGSMSSPVSVALAVGGTIASRVAQLFAGRLSADSAIAQTNAGLAATEAGWLRRNAEWKHLEAQAKLEVRQIDKQIVAGEIRLEIAELDLANHEKQMEQSREVKDFFQSKFSSEELYDWMVGQLSALHYQAYKLAYDMAKKAERAYAIERGDGTSPGIIQFGHWEGSKRGLLAGQRLALELKKLDAAYIDNVKSEYEITKTISLTELAPEKFLALIGKEKCSFIIPETEFDLDFPGHYLRRCKSMAVTAAHVSPAGDSIQLKATLTASKVRRTAKLPGELDVDPSNITAMVTSSGVNDTGLFETNLRSELLLPFEGAGVVESEWTIDLPIDTNRIDRRSMTDLLMHIRYTARDGGESRRQSVLDALKADTTLRRRRMLHVRRDFPDAFDQFQVGVGGVHTLTIPVQKGMFAPVLDKQSVQVTKTTIYFRSRLVDADTPKTWSVTIPGQSGPVWVFSVSSVHGFYDAPPSTAAWPSPWPANDTHSLVIAITPPAPPTTVSVAAIDEIWIALEYKGV
jgi:hypothetical protein